MKEVDYKREFSELYRQDETVSLVDVPPFDYLMIDGRGDPNTSPEFAAAIETLYPFCYAIRSRVMESEDLKFVVMPLEGLWWAEDMEAFDAGEKADWEWTLMIVQPDVVTDDIVDRAREDVRENKDLPALSTVRYETFDEGLAAQTLHVGPFSEEGPTVERVHEFIDENGYARRGAHHEIYLSDMRRTDPERLRTIVRQPIAE
jgi:hypothetical protein